MLALFIVLVLLSVGCAGVQSRICSRCTFIEEDFTVTKCSMCESDFLPAIANASRSGDGSSSKTAPAASSGCPVGHVMCGWPLNDGSICTHTALPRNVKSHQHELSGHSRHRQYLERTAKQTPSAFAKFFNAGSKRARDESDSPIGTTSSTRMPNVSAEANVTSSTRAEKLPAAHAPTECHDADAERLRQFEFVPPPSHAASSAASMRTRMPNESSNFTTSSTFGNADASTHTHVTRSVTPGVTPV